ncbi:hypothetical protein EV589_0008 [Mycobacterium sp. BK558]|jgi:hypothetical protein|uniref:hypothetical protein n=1 Tax=Mycolicibacterium sp. D5.8-2 TaxID=3085903 RepID=UPI00102BC714|nr:hypothetical protein [Mycolicibacterium sp. D5.8-2]MDW5615060.1 hypothetical protein [Mycolicibacterium sp. D5.8-2]RZT24301.1 hypothetical protein EV589_0008 [Mycobacterium sp. BK558]
MSGGRSSAYGFLYQYLATADYFLSYLNTGGVDAADVALLIEPTALTTGGTGEDPDIVDFAIEYRDVVVDRVQVKGSSDPSNNKLHPGEAGDVMRRLGTAGVNHLLTNRQLSSGLAERCTLAERDGSSFDRYAYQDPDPDTPPASRFILVDNRSVDDLAGSVAGHVRSARADRVLSQGEPTARMVSIVLLHHIFRSAAGTTTERFTASEILTLLKTPDDAVAHALGSFDWGVPIGGIPTFNSTVPRVEQLDEISAALSRNVNGRQPRAAILTGTTGYGKSALAADYCHLHYNAFEFMCWIDRRDSDTMLADARRYSEQLTRTRLGHKTDPTGIFLDALARHRGPWLLVFDGAPSRQAIESLIPKHGNGKIVITTPNETAWWPTVPKIQIPTFSPEEAMRCFATHADLDPSTDCPGVRAVVDRLGSIPLAVSMAGMYFGNADGTVAELSSAYFAELDALEDEGAVPPGVSNATLYAAIRHAVAHLGDGLGSNSPDEMRFAQALIYRAALIAPEKIPLNFLIAAFPESVVLRLGELPMPTEAAPAAQRRYISIFRTQSLAQRVVLVDNFNANNEAAETIRIHPLVHEVLCDIFLRDIPPGRLGEQLSMMLHELLGWLTEMRKRNAFFAVDQLAAHAEALLAVIVKVSRFEFYNQDEVKFFQVTRLMLQLELATCRMSRGDFNSSVNLARGVVLDLAEMPRDRLRDVMALVAVSSIVVDLSTAGMRPSSVAPFATLAVRTLISCESFGGSAARTAFDRAYLVRSFLNKRPEYRNDALIGRAIRAIDQIITRDPSDEIRPNVVMDRIWDLIEARDLDSVDSLIATLSDHAHSYDAVTVSCVEVVVALHRRHIDIALQRIDELIGMPLENEHLGVPLTHGLGHILRTLQELIAIPVAQSEKLISTAARVRARGEAINTAMTNS